MKDENKYTVWVGGTEVVDFYVNKVTAQNIAKSYIEDGYNEVQIEAKPTLKIVDLKVNGRKFNPYTYTKADNIEALLISSNYEVATIRVTSIGDVIVTVHSQKTSEEFMSELESIENGDYDAIAYIINGYQEYLYPFVEDDNIKNINMMLDWMSNNTKLDEEICLYIAGFTSERYIIVKHNNTGISLDSYMDLNEEPMVEKLFYFEDYDDINIVVFPTACGVTADNTPNVVIENPRTNQLMSLWHYTSF